MPFYDCHCHSEHSPDSKLTLREIADRAIELGMSGISITNHLDYFSPRSAPERLPVVHSQLIKSLADITDVKLEYAGRLEILCGAELGAPFRCMNIYAPIISDSRVDVILGSVHACEVIYDDGTKVPYSPYNDRDHLCFDRMVEAYFTDVYRNIAFCDVDVIAHITYLQRYMINNGKILFNVKKYKDACADLLKAAIVRGKAIELNTKSIIECLEPAFSELEFFRLYKDLGGELVTIGNDTHIITDLNNSRLGTDLLKAAGFTNACYYKNRKPVFYSMD